MDVLIKFLDGSFKFYKDCDDIDFDIDNYGHYTGGDYFDIYENPEQDPDTVISLDLKTVKLIDVTYHTPVGDQTDRVYFSKQPVKANNSKKEVKTMSTNENIKEQTAPAAAAEENEDDFDFADEFNHRGRLFTIDTEGFEGHKAAEVYEAVKDAPLIMKGVFINKDTGYGESVSVVTPNSIIYFGKTNLEAAHSIRDNQKAVNKINEKGAFFRIKTFYSKKFKKDGYSFEFVPKSEIPAEFKGDEACFKW